MSYGLRMHEEGVPVIAIPKTMDNDVHGTDYCIGFSTAVSRGVEFINNLRTSTGSHERIAVVELFGRYSGETSLITAYLADIDRALISEVPFDIDRLTELVMRDKGRQSFELRDDHRPRRVPCSKAAISISRAKRTPTVTASWVASANAPATCWPNGPVRGSCSRSSPISCARADPTASISWWLPNYAKLAVDLALEGVSGRMVALRSGIYTNVPIALTGEGSKRVDVDELYDVSEYRPKVRHVAGKPMFLY